MANKKEIIVTGIKYLAITLPLLFLGPFVLTIGFRAANEGNHLISGIGVFICLVAIVLGFIGVRTILRGLFAKE